jgi:hypothetical protein
MYMLLVHAYTRFMLYALVVMSVMWSLLSCIKNQEKYYTHKDLINNYIAFRITTRSSTFTTIFDSKDERGSEKALPQYNL